MQAIHISAVLHRTARRLYLRIRGAVNAGVTLLACWCADSVGFVLVCMSCSLQAIVSFLSMQCIPLCSLVPAQSCRISTNAAYQRQNGDLPPMTHYCTCDSGRKSSIASVAALCRVASYVVICPDGILGKASAEPEPAWPRAMAKALVHAVPYLFRCRAVMLSCGWIFGRVSWPWLALVRWLFAADALIPCGDVQSKPRVSALHFAATGARSRCRAGDCVRFLHDLRLLHCITSGNPSAEAALVFEHVGLIPVSCKPAKVRRSCGVHRRSSSAWSPWCCMRCFCRPAHRSAWRTGRQR